MVKNPGQSDLKDPTFDRHASEKNFFKSKEPWARLQKSRVGVESLQGQLRDILTEMVKKEFPNVCVGICCSTIVCCSYPSRWQALAWFCHRLLMV